MTDPNVEATRAISFKPCPLCDDWPEPGQYICDGKTEWILACEKCKLTTDGHVDWRDVVLEWNGAVIRAQK